MRLCQRCNKEYGEDVFRYDKFANDYKPICKGCEARRGKNIVAETSRRYIIKRQARAPRRDNTQ